LTKTLLLDADIMAYRSAFNNQIEEEVEPGYWTWGCSLPKVKEDILKYIDYIMELLKADKYILCLSDTTNFRKEILKDYKASRGKVKKPIVLKKVREWLLEEGAVMKPSLEGDDILGIISTSPNLNNDERIICSIDKDMKSIEGLYYRDEDTGVVSITKGEADYYHLYQTLVGDITDGYKGLEGTGPVAAKKILSDSSTWSSVVSAYVKKGLTEEDALVQARCARILRYQDYDFEKKEPILWTP